MSPSTQTSKRFLVCTVLLMIISTQLFSRDLLVPRHNAIGESAFIINILALGVLIGLLAYTIFLAISTKELMFIYFSVIMVLLTILQTFSAFDRFIFSLTYNRVTIITHLLFITFLLFFENFFRLREFTPRLSKINRISIYTIIGYTLFFLAAKAILVEAPAFHNLLNFIRELFVFYTNILFVYTIIRALQWMRTEALLLLIAFIPPALLTSINAMQIFPFMSSYQQLVGFLMTYNQPIGLSLQAILFSLAMGNRFNRIRIEREQSMQESNHLRQIDAQKTEFFMNMSHELRTPLTIILGMVQQVRNQRYGASIHYNDRVFETIERNCLKLLKQVDHLLLLEKGPHLFTGKPFLIHPTIEQVVDEFRPLIQQHQLSITVTLAEHIVEKTLAMDSDDFQTVLMNLISNAIKFTPPEGSIHISGSLTDEGSLSIAVEDTGVGIASDDQIHIFERYYYKSGSTNFGQSGLGLTLTQSIMNHLGGRVLIESRKGVGSTFTLLFPASMIADMPSNASLQRTATGRSALYMGEILPTAEQLCALEGKPEHIPLILVVEDNPDMCRYILDILSESYRVICAQHGLQALHLLHQITPHLIVCDIMMPLMDGKQFLSELRSRYQENPIPLIFLTARDSVEEKIDSLQAGAVHYLTKPFSGEILLATIATTLTHDQQVASSRTELMKKRIDAVFEEIESPTLPRKERSIEHFIAEHTLSARETEILRLLLAGKSDKEIAEQLAISTRTVANHNRHLYQKAEVKGRYELVARFYKDSTPVAFL